MYTGRKEEIFPSHFLLSKNLILQLMNNNYISGYDSNKLILFIAIFETNESFDIHNLICKQKFTNNYC